MRNTSTVIYCCRGEPKHARARDELRARAGGSCAVRAVGPVGGSDVLSRGLWDGSNSLTSISISARYKGIRRRSKSV